MSDLISRSDVLELQRYSFGVSMLNSEEYIKVSDVDNILTAYDIDNVVEELEERQKEYLAGFGVHNNDEMYGVACGLGDAIEIVKQGGVREDVSKS